MRSVSDELQMVRDLGEVGNSDLLELRGLPSMTLRSCDMLFIMEVDGKAKIFCEKRNRKGSLNKCLKCIKKTEGLI